MIYDIDQTERKKQFNRENDRTCLTLASFPHQQDPLGLFPLRHCFPLKLHFQANFRTVGHNSWVYELSTHDANCPLLDLPLLSSARGSSTNLPVSIIF